jgi:hypothetical protein
LNNRKRRAETMKKIILLLAVFTVTVCLNAIDTGLILDQYAKHGREQGQDKYFDYQLSLIPRLSVMGENTDLFVSGALSLGYEEDFYYIHEILRTEFSILFNSAKLEIGRMEYSAPFEYLASSLFDGFQFTYNTAFGAFSAGAWYTGFLYKRNAVILMTDEDFNSYAEPVEYKRLSQTYFASRRAVGALSWEHPAVAQKFRVEAALMAQIDFNGDEDAYLNSQYVTAKIGVPVKSLLFEAGGALQLAQTENGSRTGAAAEAGVFWTPPSSFPSRLSFSGYFSSGDSESGLKSFTPVNTRAFGEVLSIMHSGFSAVSLGIAARLHRTFSVNLNSSIILPSLFGDYTNYVNGTAEDKDYFLGGEFYSSLVWSPASDLQFNLGSGIGLFRPEMVEPSWHVKLSITRSLY